MDTRTREAIRYLGYGNHAVDEQTMALVQDSFEELDRTAQYRIIYRIFELKVTDSDRIEIGKLDITSKNLAKNIRGCDQAILLGATLGIETDQLIRRYSLIDMPHAVVIQACAAALLEEELDRWQEGLKQEMAAEGYYLRPRFSPGYGDFDIRHQRELLQMLDCAKKIGLTVTDSLMLNPTKSVTAVIGISREDMQCHRSGCEVCGKKDCIYRRNSV